MEKAFQVSQCTEKSFPSFPFQSSNKNSKFSCYISLYEINCIKIRTMSLALNLTILAEILCVLFTLTSSFDSDRKAFQLVERIFSVART